MAKKAPAKYSVLVGCNVPDPSGKRDERGRPEELRFEVGDEISETSVTPAALATLLSTGAIRPSSAAVAEDSAEPSGQGN